MNIYDRDWYKEGNKKTPSGSNEPPKVDPKYKFESVGGFKGYDPTYGCGDTSSSFTNTNAQTVHAETAKTGDIRYCHKCGKELKSGADFCSYCGANQNESNTYNSFSTVEQENTGDRPRARHGFVTFWLILGVCVGVIIFFDSFSRSTTIIANLFDYPIAYTRISAIVSIGSFVLLLYWKKIGFWLNVGNGVIGTFVMFSDGSFVALSLFFNALSVLINFGVLNIRKNGITTWEQLT